MGLRTWRVRLEEPTVPTMPTCLQRLEVLEKNKGVKRDERRKARHQGPFTGLAFLFHLEDLFTAATLCLLGLTVRTVYSSLPSCDMLWRESECHAPGKTCSTSTANKNATGTKPRQPPSKTCFYAQRLSFECSPFYASILRL